MKSKFLPQIQSAVIQEKKESDEALFELFVEPLHEELYKRQTFDFLNDLSDGQQLLLSYDYVRQQVLQGGFIQLIQNGYIGLLPMMPGWLYTIGAPDMAQVIDDVLKVYVLNRDLLSRKTTLEEFALLYQELKEFEGIDARFTGLNAPTIHIMMDYALRHIEDFAALKH